MVHLLDIVGDTMEWTNDRIDELRRLWGQGQTASRIADLLGGITRNAVIGKAHRLGLRGRPSPIRRDENAPMARSIPVPRVRMPAPIRPELPPLEAVRAAPPPPPATSAAAGPAQAAP